MSSHLDGLEAYLDMDEVVTMMWEILGNQTTDQFSIAFFFRQIDLVAQFAGMGSIETMIAYWKTPTNLVVGIVIHQITEFEEKYNQIKHLYPSDCSYLR